MNNEIELAAAPFIPDNLARKSKYLRLKRYLHLLGVTALIITYLLLAVGSIVKISLQGQGPPDERVSSNLYSALDNLGNQIISLQPTSSDSKPIDIKTNGTESLKPISSYYDPITIRINGTGIGQNITENLP